MADNYEHGYEPARSFIPVEINGRYSPHRRRGAPQIVLEGQTKKIIFVLINIITSI
jgi:hypothetical protein